MLETLKQFLVSRKAVAFLVGLVAVVLGYALGVPPDQLEPMLTKVVILVAGYIGGQGLADFGKEAKRAEVEKK